MTRQQRTKERGNGEGTYFEDPFGSGRWRVVVTIAGRRTSRIVHGREADAKRKLRELLKARDDKRNLQGGRQTVNAWLDTWLDEVKKPKVSADTLDDYRDICRLHIRPHLGGLRLEALRAEDVQRWMNGLADPERKPKPLAPETIRNAYARLRTALNDAKRWKYVTENVAEDADPPEAGDPRGVALEPAQAQQLLAAVAGDPFSEALYLVALRLGLRRGELLGLRWADVDFDRATVSVGGQLKRIAGELRHTPKTKTKAGRRDIPIDDDLAAVLRTWHAVQAQDRLRHGAAWKAGDLVFTTSTGRPIIPRNLLTSFKRLLKRAKLPDVRFHDLRHTAGSLMLADGAQLVDVSEVLGHASPATTARIYAHSFEDGKRRAITGTARLLGRKVS